MRVGIVLAVLIASGCQLKKEKVYPRAPEQALVEIVQAARTSNFSRVYELLDKSTRWSILSVFKNQREMCTLVRKHYPGHRQERELRRCHLADSAPDGQAFFVALVKHRRVALGPLSLVKPTKTPRRRHPGSQVVLTLGGHKLPFYEEDAHWFYGGLREHFEQQKLKAARDLMTVKENIESFR